LALETLFAGNYSGFDAVVVDNDSGDASVEHIVSWAQGDAVPESPSALFARVKLRSSPNALPCNVIYEPDLGSAPPPGRLTVIRATKNAGFAAGNNLALKYLLRHGAYKYFWLLNNDAFPAPDALRQLVLRAETDQAIGMVGSTLIYAGRPDTIQALGGAEYRRADGSGRHIGAETPLSSLSGVDAIDVERRMAYVVGASLLVSKAFLVRVGLMEERYFLYYEEIDWAERGKADFKLGYAKDSLVYHKAGGSTQKASRRSEAASYYIARNRIIFARRFYPEHVSTVWRATLLDALRYAAKARWSEARGFARAVLEAWRRPGEVW
jgi:GT2 family glycosyltransferase